MLKINSIPSDCDYRLNVSRPFIKDGNTCSFWNIVSFGVPDSGQSKKKISNADSFNNVFHSVSAMVSHTRHLNQPDMWIRKVVLYLHKDKVIQHGNIWYCC